MWQVLKFDLLINRKQNITTFAKMTLAAFLIFFFFFVSKAWYYPNGQVGEIDEGNAVMAFFIICFGTVFYGTQIFKHMDTKQHRTNYLMIPASTAEKMVARLLITAVILPLAGIVAIVTADALRWLVHITTQTGLNGTLTWPALRFIWHTPWQATVAVMLLTIWGQSLFILGGTLFSRRQWILTIVGMIFLAMTFGGIVTNTLHDVIDGLMSNGYTINEDMLLWGFVCTFTTFTLLNYWLSYLIFRRMQVINNKWLNL